MQYSNTKPERKGRISKRLIAFGLLVALLLQLMAFTCSAVADAVASFFGVDSEKGSSVNGFGKFNSDEVVAKLKKDFLGSINKDLIMKIEDQELRGETEVIITFSDTSLVGIFAEAEASKRMSFAQYRTSSYAKRLEKELAENRSNVLNALSEAGLISDVKHTYSSIMDGAFVRTTYEQIEEICNFEGVERVMLSNTYLPAAAVENPVDVYGTGIFNSGSVSYTGKGTIVAILDMGCDYTHSAFTTHEVVSPLYDRDDIAEKLPNLIAYSYDTSVEAREVYYGNITGGKIAFGYDYADKDPDIMPFTESHGTHVAGIIGGYDDTITGVAIDTQLAIMKVFSDYDDGATDGDILAALEDAILLNVDAINMSLGSSCGFTREVDELFKNEVFDNIEKAGISLVVAASNDYSSGFGSEQGNTNKTHNPDSATVGAPATYEASLGVASINGSKEKYMLANGDLEVFFHEAVNQNAKEYDFFEMLGVSAQNPRAEFEYVTIPGYGYAINYAGLDMQGKIALVRRGDITFEEKVQFAYEAGACAVIIYNNVFGEISMTVGNDLKIPVISIGKDEGDAMATKATGTLLFDYNNLAGPFMSDFSSWGPTPDLKLKPEITAHGGNILSAIPGGEYEELSGTSMAAPNMTGIVVLIRQYVKEKYPKLTDPEVRDLVNQLCMSTATIALDQKGNPYSPRKQGAGIADIAKSTTTPAYLYVLDADGKDKGKTKLELGDDPARTGVYTMTIELENLSDKNVSYRIGHIAMTESVSTSDPEYVAEMAYLLSCAAEYSVRNGSFSDGIVTVEPGKTASVTVTLTLSKADKAYLNENFANGMYVEGFLTFDNVEDGGVDLNAPFLAFYGDWGEAPIFDLDYYEVETEAHNNAIDEDDKIKADYYATTPTGTYYYDYVIPLGAYVYNMDETEYTPIPATREHAAISYYADTISGIYSVFSGLLRGAKELNISIVNTSTGEVVWTDTQYNCAKAHYYGSPSPYNAIINLETANPVTGEVLGNNNTRFEVTMTAKLDWDGGARNSSDTYSFSFYIDYEAPSVVDATFRTVYDKGREENRYYADIMVYDNHYAMSIRPIIVYDMTKENGEIEKTYASLTDDPIPIYQENRGEASKVSIEITDYLDIITDSANPEGLTVYIDDYALNGSVCYIPFPEVENSDMEFSEEVRELELDIHQTLDLTAYLVHKDTATPVEPDYLKALTWTSSDESVVAISDGKIEALKHGTATIRVTGSSWVATETVSGQKVEVPIYKSITVNVSEEEVKNPNSSELVPIESLEFTSYNTLFAFNGDIDYSEIGQTGSLNYFGGSNSISCYPSEKVKLNYTLEPWNMAEHRYTLEWTSSNSKVATVDENGVVTAQAEGVARITLKITIDGKTSLLAARCTVTVKSEFIIENRTLIAYKGKGGDVVIPDDEGIMIIGAFAFCHYNLDHEREVEKDENGYYDIDLKKDPIGNNTVTSVVIPEGVETIEKYAFYNCKLLRDVTLPEECKTIGEYAFAKCDMLGNVNFDNVNVIGDYAFYQCESLVCDDIGGVNLSGVYAVGDYAFAGTRFSSIELTTLSRTGVGAFSDCPRLTSVTLGRKTRVSESMFENTPLTEIVVYSDIVSDAAFKGCTKLEGVEFKNDLTYLGMDAFAGCSKLSEVVFEGACERIAEYAFSDCTSLKNFVLPDSAVALGDGAFAESGISKLTFGANTVITESGIVVFDGVRSLTVDLSDTNTYTLSGGALYTDGGKTLVLLLPGSTASSFTVPAEVTKIFDGAFSSNSYLRTVSFASGSLLDTIGVGAFAYCDRLESVLLPDREITIGEWAFAGDSALKTIDLKKVSSVGEYAFTGSGITTVNLAQDGVEIGYGAFWGCTSLDSVTLGAAAKIGEYAFYNSSVRTVTLLGGGVTVADAAFCACLSLESFDFADVVGKLGNFAFYGCVALTSVDAPGITEVGNACFADCYGLVSFRAELLEIVGESAFSTYIEDDPEQGTYATQGSSVKTFYAPNLKKVGDGAFYLCIYLESIDLSRVTEIGTMAFAMCEALEEATLSKELSELADFVFYDCISLSCPDLSHIVRFGKGSLYGVRLPSRLVLPSAEYIGAQAFIESTASDAEHNLVEFEAPELTYIGDQAFTGCSELRRVHAPKLEELGAAAFAFTAIEEFEISNALKVVGTSPFEGSESFTAFFTTVDGEPESVYTKEYDNVMIKDGALYTVTDNGYMLVCYPMAKEGEELVVIDGTVRLGHCAALGNKNLQRVILPESLRYIGNFAFYDCDSLETVVFKSYYAPTLEGTLTGDTIEITPDTIESYPGFDKLYKYDYYYKMEGTVASPYYYSIFVDVVTSERAMGLTYVLPENNSGYDSLIYRAYFTPSETETSGTVMGPYAIAFIDAVKKLPSPEEVDRFDQQRIEAAINAYNALDGRADEMAYVDESYIVKFHEARTSYNISVAENKIGHLFDMANSKYFFELVKDARATYLSLTEQERALVSNAAVLDTKIDELAAEMGVTLDFSRTYEEHIPPSAPGDDPGVTPGPADGDNGGVWMTVIIISASVVGAALLALGVILFLKKRKAVSSETSQADESFDPGQKED